MDGWSGDASGNNAEVTITVDGNKMSPLTSLKIISTFTLNVEGGGTTDPFAGVYTYDSESVMSVKAIPAAGYRFDGWSGDATGLSTTTIRMDGNKNVTAKYTKVTYWLTINVQGGGVTNPTVVTWLPKTELVLVLD